MEKRWVIAPPITPEFQNQFPEIAPVVLQLLHNRGITTQKAIDEFLNPDYGDDVHDPFLFRDMDKAVERLLRAIERKEQIVVHGDYDADGVSGSVILASIIQSLGGRAGIYIPHRETEGYGVNVNTIHYLEKQKTNLIITCDCGISNHDEIALAQSKGMDVIITDHHTLPPKLPPAYAIIHPLASGETYPFHGLAGGGVAFKLAQGLLRKTSANVPKEELEKWLLDLVAISTIADMMPLLGENRTLVRYGLIVLNKTRRLGLQKLIAALSNGSRRTMDTNTVAWYLVPRINAAGRMDHANIAYNLLLSADAREAEQLAEKLNMANRERQEETATLVRQVKEQIVGHTDNPVLFAIGDDWPLGLVGLVAGKIAEEYGHPTIIMTRRQGDISGSGRSIQGLNLIQALQTIPKYFRKFGGHPMACGFTLVHENELLAMQEALSAIVQALVPSEKFFPTISVDAAVHLRDCTWELYEHLQQFEPFGEGNPRPRYVVSGVSVEGCVRMGTEGKHLRLSVNEGGERRTMIGFGFGTFAERLTIGATIDVVFEVGVNEWNGNRELQFKIVDLRQHKDSKLS